jgi:hypothetical protein
MKEKHVVDLRNESVWDYVRVLNNVMYVFTKEVRYFSERYGKWIVCEVSDLSDGATCARDLNTFGWGVHDDLCRTGKFEDGSKCSNWQASRILSDILKIEGYGFSARTWLIGTWLFGGGKARDNGMI